MNPSFPPLPLEEWESSKNTLHLFVQIVGKIRLKLMPKKNHWWHVTLYVSSAGLTTRPIPYGKFSFEIEFDFIRHQLVIRTSDGRQNSFALEDGLSVAAFYETILRKLSVLGITVKILARPYDIFSKEPFAKNTSDHSYDKEYVQRFWKILGNVNAVFEQFSGGFCGKTCPVHLYWHHMDLVVTRFSGREGPPMEGVSQVEKEAYSHEVISFGFWAGDENVREAAFYSYTYPSPPGLEEEPLNPREAKWQISNNSPMALLMYKDVISKDDPRQAIFDFLESAYSAGARKASWNMDQLKLKV